MFPLLFLENILLIKGFIELPTSLIEMLSIISDLIEFTRKYNRRQADKIGTHIQNSKRPQSKTENPPKRIRQLND